MIKEKNISIKTAANIAAVARKQGKKVVTTNGCFDILHSGHVKNLQTIKKLGDILIVGVNSDASVRRNKGPLRPIVTAKERTLMLAGLACVDYVFVFSNKSPIVWIKKIRPAIHAKGKGSEHSPAFEAERRAVEEAGGRIFLAPHTKGKSTTDIIRTIVKRYKK